MIKWRHKCRLFEEFFNQVDTIISPSGYSFLIYPIKNVVEHRNEQINQKNASQSERTMRTVWWQELSISVYHYRRNYLSFGWNSQKPETFKSSNRIVGIRRNMNCIRFSPTISKKVWNSEIAVIVQRFHTQIETRQRLVGKKVNVSAWCKSCIFWARCSAMRNSFAVSGWPPIQLWERKHLAPSRNSLPGKVVRRMPEISNIKNTTKSRTFQ